MAVAVEREGGRMAAAERDSEPPPTPLLSLTSITLTHWPGECGGVREKPQHRKRVGGGRASAGRQRVDSGHRDARGLEARRGGRGRRREAGTGTARDTPMA